MKAITNGKIILEDGIVEGYDVLIEKDKIYDIVPSDETDNIFEISSFVDAKGGYISPGFIDIHADYIEHMSAPRPTCLMDFNMALKESERELLTHGISTMFHSLSLLKHDIEARKPIRNPENVKKFVEMIHEHHGEKHLIRHRFHLRYEIDNIDQYDLVKEYIKDKKVQLLSFMDHTPGQGQYRDMEKYRQILKGYDDKITDDEIDARVKDRQANQKVSFEDLSKLAKLAIAAEIPIASHDDDSEEKLDIVRELGVSISEFPVELEVARAAKQKGMFTVAGAPNVLLGGSHSGNLAAHEAINEGLIDVLSSDYYPAALLHSAFKLHRDFGMPLHETINLISLGPAKAVKYDDILGSIKKGKLADILIIELIEDDFPVITSCFVGGEHVFETRYR